ncbi:dTDP-glucose 4,6-dehydratase [Neobacillus drentensis]|uniref:dTDP-glucose 4,6-dehydratase n=1 Tax=Neobacillus drentensis TaxID=220684 RepID=UPI002FFFF1C1
MNQETVLVTGGAGFIGSNFLPFFLERYNKYHVINLDSLTYAGDIKNLSEIEDNENYQFIKGDICEKNFVLELFRKYNIKHVIHFAAESHVDNSIKNPLAFAETNVMGTLNLLEAARKSWMDQPFQYKEAYKNSRFHHISTDEVYGTLGKEGFFTESTSFAPNSPYSASKAGSDLLVRSYYHTYGLNVITTNCSNNYGPKQHDEKLIPTIIRRAISGEIIPIYGNGQNIRDWLYVLDHCKAIDIAFHKGISGETYLIGGHNEITNLKIAETICNILDQKVPRKTSYHSLITFVEDRPGHDYRYAINPAKITSELNWKADETFETGILKTIEWYLDKYLGEGTN